MTLNSSLKVNVPDIISGWLAEYSRSPKTSNVSGSASFVSPKLFISCKTMLSSLFFVKNIEVEFGALKD